MGDSFGVYPTNDPALVDAVIKAIDAPADFPIAGKTLRQMLTEEMSLGTAPDMLFELISYMVGGERKTKAKALAQGEDPDGDAATLDVLAAVEKFPGIRPDPEAFVECLDALQPRLYSISSSPKVDPHRLSLTVDHVRYEVDGRTRLGVASTFLSHAIAPGTPLKVYVQRAHNFALPADPATPIIMVGPGTGVAPFRAFLHERMVTQAPGDAWLFFGHQRRACDFFYEDEFSGLQERQVLTRLSLRLVARHRHAQDLRAGPHARGSRRAVDLAAARRAFLCLRRRPAHGGRRREDAGHDRRHARRPGRAQRQGASSPTSRSQDATRRTCTSRECFGATVRPGEPWSARARARR